MAFALDDDAVLRAAFAFVDSFSDAQVKMTPARRLAEQLRSLRDEAASLQVQLTAISAALQGRDSSLHDNAWRHVARCQKERRRRAEDENSRLRARLKDHVRLARRFAKVVASDSRKQKIFMKSSIPRSLGSCGSLDLASEALGMCNEAATIFSKPPFVTHPALRTMVTRRTTSPGQIVELMDSRVMPFDYRVMGEALWYHLTHHRVPGEVLLNQVRTDKRHSEHNFVSEDTEYKLNLRNSQDKRATGRELERELRFRFSLSESVRPGLFHGNVAARRMASPAATGIVIVWVVDIAAEVDDGSRSTTRFSMTEKVWTLVQPLLLDPLQPTRTAAQVQTYVISGPSHHRHHSKSREAIHLEEHIGSIQAHLEEQWALVESLLLDPSWVSAHQPEKMVEENETLRN